MILKKLNTIIQCPTTLPRNISFEISTVMNLSNLKRRHIILPDLTQNSNYLTKIFEDEFWKPFYQFLQDNLKSEFRFKISYITTESEPYVHARVLILYGVPIDKVKDLWYTFKEKFCNNSAGPGIFVDDPKFENKSSFDKEIEIENEVHLIFRNKYNLQTNSITHSNLNSKFFMKIKNKQPFYFSDGVLWIKKNKDKKNRDIEEGIRYHSLEPLNEKNLIPDLFYFIFCSFQNQKYHWNDYKIKLNNERLIDTKPYRLIRLETETMRLSIDPTGKLGKNWRARIFKGLSILSHIERLTRINGRTIQRGDRIIRNVIDGKINATHYFKEGTLLSVLAKNKILPSDAFFIEISIDFIESLYPIYQSEIDNRYTFRLSEFKENSDASLLKNEIKSVERHFKQEKSDKPYSLHSPRLQTVSKAYEWPYHVKILSELLLKELTIRKGRKQNNSLLGNYEVKEVKGKEYFCANGISGRGLRIRSWIDKIKSFFLFESFKDLSKYFVHGFVQLSHELRLIIKIKGEKYDGLDFLRCYESRITEILDKVMFVYIPDDYEKFLAEKLSSLGIISVDSIEQRDGQHSFISRVDIRIERKRLGMTQKNLAEKLSVTSALVSGWENGRKKISAEKEQMLRKIFYGTG